MRYLYTILTTVMLLFFINEAHAQKMAKTKVRSLITATHFKLFEEPISTQKLDGFMRFYASTGNKEYAYNIIIQNLLNNDSERALPPKVYLKNIAITIPDVRKNYSERIFAMWFNMTAYSAIENEELFIISMIQLSVNNKENLPNLPVNEVDIKSTNNSCEFAISINNVYNNWAMKNPEELKNFVALHEKFYLKWKTSNSQGNYRDFSKAMESWTSSNTPFDFVKPSNINTCGDLVRNHQLAYNESELVENARIQLAKVYRSLLNRSPKSEESLYLTKKVGSKEVKLKELLFLILTSKEYQGDML